MKNKTIAWTILAILLAVGTVVALLIFPQRNSYFWISYAFAMLGVLAVWSSSFLTSRRMKGSVFPVELPRIILSLIYLAVVLILIAIFSLSSLSPGVYFSIQLIVLAIAVIADLIMHMAIRHVAGQERAVNAQVIDQRMLTDEFESIYTDIRNLSAECQESLSPAADRLLEQLRYSDPTGSRVANLDTSIWQQLSTLKEAVYQLSGKCGSPGDVLALIEHLQRSVEERNRKLKLTK